MDKVTINGINYIPETPDSSIRIVVLDRGYVVVGIVSEVGEYIVINKCACIRRWGTERGLGQIAADGPTENTILDPQPRTRVHKLQVVQMIDCEVSKWKL